MNSVKLIQPLPVERDAQGFWSHPGIPNLDEDYEAYRKWLDAQGLETTYALLESEPDDHPVYLAYLENEEPSFAAWEPQAPDGDGWFTLSVHDTNDGPIWVWARRTQAGEALLGGAV
jgi:hypothetical protein